MLADVSLSESGVCVYEPLGITATSSRETGATQGRRGAPNLMQSQPGSKQTLTYDASQTTTSSYRCKKVSFSAAPGNHGL